MPADPRPTPRDPAPRDGGHPDVKGPYARLKSFPKSCPVMERTGDGLPVGMCWHYLGGDDTCPRHGKIPFSESTP